MTGKRYKSVGANLECPNGKEYMLVKRDDGFNVCQVCSKYTAKEIVDELNNLADENEQLRKEKECDKQVFTKKRLHERLQQTQKENEQLKETNQELYDFRLVLNALLFNEWVKNGKYEVYKSKRHHDGSIPFPDDNEDWFIVVAILPSGQVTNHYHIKYWDYFKIPSYPKVKDEFDGHTSSVVLLRYGVLLE